LKNEYQFVAVLDFSGKHIAIHFPDLDEALSQADTIEQAVRRSEEVLKLTIESRLDDKEYIPEPTQLDKIELLDGQRTIIVSCSLKEKIKYDKKTLTIPHDLNIAAEAMGLNFSQVLQNALREKIADKESV
jgi:predicted RNase H-like HicB family nuclease